MCSQKGGSGLLGACCGCSYDCLSLATRKCLCLVFNYREMIALLFVKVMLLIQLAGAEILSVGVYIPLRGDIEDVEKC